METKRCSGYKGVWACGDDYPDHIVPVENFTRSPSRHDGLEPRCQKCAVLINGYNNPQRNSISARAYKMAGGSKAFYELPKEKRLELRKMAKEGWTDMYPKPNTNVVPMFKRDEPVGKPMRTREPGEMQGEMVPQGWVYVVQNPDIPHILKIGKTYPDGIGSIMSSARRFGRAILVEKHYFDEALKAETAIHAILNKWNMRNLGYEDCGRELFKCSINCFRKALREYQKELENDPSVSEG